MFQKWWKLQFCYLSVGVSCLLMLKLGSSVSIFLYRPTLFIGYTLADARWPFIATVACCWQGLFG